MNRSFMTYKKQFEIFSESQSYIISILLILAVGIFSSDVFAQRRDHLTDTESDVVREAQILDKRIEVLVKFIDRRLLVVENPNAVEAKKDAEKFGALPKGTNIELFGDIARILDDSMTNIDDVANRDAKNVLVPKALKILSTACKRLLPQFNALREKSKDNSERGILTQAIENAEAIIEADSNFANN